MTQQMKHYKAAFEHEVFKGDIPDSARLFEDYIKSGKYARKKQEEEQIKVCKSFMRNKLYEYEGRRFQFDGHNLVARFVPKFIWEWDYEGLLDHLTDYLSVDVLVKQRVLDLDAAQIKKSDDYPSLEPYALDRTYTPRPYFNKFGKSFNQETTESPREDFTSMDDAILEYRFASINQTQYEQEYEALKERLLECSVLNEEGKVEHEFGSIKLVGSPLKFNRYQVLDELGEEPFIHHPKISTTKLKELCQKGYLSWDEVTLFRDVKSTRVDFVLMDLESEQKMFEGMREKDQRILEQKLGSEGGRA
ncbi:hypothetical protein ACTWQB_16195 [Piscibacillus sp. B03]|uniref:hypothetical protein n=1 Tax=Piscibacillus sp. B03 TaxID=3457430 RepID=UPI003FCD5F2B